MLGPESQCGIGLVSGKRPGRHQIRGDPVGSQIQKKGDDQVNGKCTENHRSDIQIKATAFLQNCLTLHLP